MTVIGGKNKIHLHMWYDKTQGNASMLQKCFATLEYFLLDLNKFVIPQMCNSAFKKKQRQESFVIQC